MKNDCGNLTCRFPQAKIAISFDHVIYLICSWNICDAFSFLFSCLDSINSQLQPIFMYPMTPPFSISGVRQKHNLEARAWVIHIHSAQNKSAKSKSLFSFWRTFHCCRSLCNCWEYLYLYSLIESARCESWNTLLIILRLQFIFGLSDVAYSPPTRNCCDTIHFLKFIRAMATTSGFSPRIHQFHESNEFVRYEKKFQLWFVRPRKTSEVEFSLFRV